MSHTGGQRFHHEIFSLVDKNVHPQHIDTGYIGTRRSSPMAHEEAGSGGFEDDDDQEEEEEGREGHAASTAVSGGGFDFREIIPTILGRSG